MAREHILVRHKLAEIMKYKNINNMITDNIKKYCMNSNLSCVEIRPEFINAMQIIIDSRLNNEDPSNILMKQNIRNILNKINSKNFNECISNLKNIKFTGSTFFKLLANEVIERSMNDPIATQIFEPSENDIYISNINARIIKEFYTQSITNNTNNTNTNNTNNLDNFGTMFIKELHTQFKEFMDSTKKFDNFNQHRNNNYLGFMNFLGVLHGLEILPKELPQSIIKIPMKKLVFDEKWDIIESTHAYTGIIKFVKQILFSIEKNDIIYDIKYLESIRKALNEFEQLNKSVQKFRIGTIMKHNKFIERFDIQIKKCIGK
jgi:hypothetical protein